MWMEKLACKAFFFLIHHLNQCQSPEPIKAASNVVIAFKWLKSLILWCWHVQKGMGDEDVCVDTQLFSLDSVLMLGQCSENSKYQGQYQLIHTKASGFPLLQPYLP